MLCDADVDSACASSSDQVLPFHVSRRFCNLVPFEYTPAATQKVVDTHETPIRRLSSEAEVESEDALSSDHVLAFQVSKRFWPVPPFR